MFLKSLGQLDEATVVTTLKNPSDTLIEAQKQAEESRFARAEQGKILRTVGMGVGAVVGGILVGVTGGLAAPLVGAGVATVLGWLGVGGSLAGLLASALASSSVVCGALFGIYGAQSTASMIARHTKEVRDLALVPVGERSGYDTLGVRVCVSGWLTNKDDVVAPWRKASKDDTFAIQWVCSMDYIVRECELTVNTPGNQSSGNFGRCVDDPSQVTCNEISTERSHQAYDIC